MLQFLQTMATLYLPTLNADIIDDGVVKGDTGYIWRVGGMMVAVTLAQIVCSIAAVYFGAQVGHGAGPRHPGSRSSVRCRTSRNGRSASSARRH